MRTSLDCKISHNITLDNHLATIYNNWYNLIKSSNKGSKRNEGKTCD
jgi:hypothetical protein